MCCRERAIFGQSVLVEAVLKQKTVIYFKNPNVGIVQAPQCYYNVNSNNIGLFYEYRSFFAIVMHQAQRLNLVTFLGTMGLIKADLLKKGLKWNEWCITEDVEAGVNINSQGYSGVYIDECLGKGLMPFDYSSLIKQRQRWTYGNMQIIKKDLLSMILGSNRTLSIQQKFAFLAQLVTWFHFELIIAITYLSLNICLLLNNNDVALIFSNNLMVTLLAISMISNLIYFMVGLRKDATLIQRFKAFLVHYGLLYTMSSSWLTCLLGHELGFNVTRKEKKEKNTPISQYYKELIIIIILSFGLIISILRGDNNITSIIIVLLTLILEISGIAYLFKSFKEPKS